MDRSILAGIVYPLGPQITGYNERAGVETINIGGVPMANDPAERKRQPTLSDVARAAGVSIATASYVLSNRAGVNISAPTRERVAEAAERLHYRRNALAAALRTGGPRQVGIFSAVRPRGIMAEIALACAEVAVAGGFTAALHIGSAPAFEPGRFDGAIILGDLPIDADLPRLKDGSVPVVEIGGTATGCQVHADDFGGARKCVEHLLSLGHRRIAHFAGSQSNPAYQERLRGFLDAVHEAGLRMDATPVVHNEADLAEALRPLVRPTGVLAFNDEAAMITYRCGREAGLTLPTDLSIVGFDDEAFAGAVEPALTTMRVAPELMAGSAFALLERQFAREEIPQQTLVATSLVVRASATAR